MKFQPIDPIIRFWDKVEMIPFHSCWEWIGTKTTQGYGTFIVNSKLMLAHRFSYELHKSKIPDGLHIDHLCRNRLCVNPIHLEAVTIKENILRGISPAANNSKKTHCKFGHALSGKNLYFYRQRNIRVCIECRKKNLRALYQRKKKHFVNDKAVEDA